MSTDRLPRALVFGALAAVVLSAACGRPAPYAGQDAAPRHLLLITLDTTRADALGFMGDPQAATPVLDRLAAAGRVYTRAMGHSPQTLPAHASILTGRYPYRHGVRQNGGFVLAAEVPTLATVLRDAGFATAAFVAAYPLDSGFGLDRGFDTYDDDLPAAAGGGLPERRGDQVVAAGSAWWHRQQAEAPERRRFLWLHLFDPHHPYAPPEPFASRFAGDPYRGEIAAVDAYLAPLLEPLLAAADGATLVAVTSDHGEGLGEHGETRHGIFAYQTTLASALVLWSPTLAPARDDRLARHVDLMPTVLDGLGLTAAAADDDSGSYDGVSLLRPPPAAPIVSYFEALAGTLQFDWAPLRGVVRAGDQHGDQHLDKYIDLPLPELYDLAADPGERDNRIDRQRRLAHQLRALLPAGSAWPPAAGEVPPAVAANLRSLGYLGGGESGAATRRYGPGNDPKRLIHLGQALLEADHLRRRGRLPAALGAVETVLAARPSMAWGHDLRAQLLLDLGQPAAAIGAMEEARAAGAASPAVIRRLGLTLAAVGRGREALAVLAPAAERGDSAERNALATVLLELGRPQAARSQLEAALAAAPDDPETHETLATLALREGHWAAARDHCQRALAGDPHRADAWNSLGVARYQLGERKEALAAWRQALAIDPQLHDTLYNLGTTAAALGATEEARQALERFLATAPPAVYATDRARAAALLERLGG